MTAAEGHFEVAPEARVFERALWKCEKCGLSGWQWVESGAKPALDRCPHRRPGTVKPRGRR